MADHFLNVDFFLQFIGPLHIPAKRPGFDADPVIRHPLHTWSYDSTAGYDTQYHSQYSSLIERDRKPIYYGYHESQFPQVNI